MSVWRRCGSPGAALLVALGLDLIAVAGCGPDAARGNPRSSELCAARPSFCDRGNLLAHHERPGRPATQGGERHSRLCLRGGGHVYPPRILEGKDLEMLRSIRAQEFDALMQAVIARDKAAKRMRSKRPRRAWQVKTASQTQFCRRNSSPARNPTVGFPQDAEFTLHALKVSLKACILAQAADGTHGTHGGGRSTGAQAAGGADSEVIEDVSGDSDFSSDGGHLLFFFTLVSGPSRSLSLKLSDTRVYEPHGGRLLAGLPALLNTTLLLTCKSLAAAHCLISAIRAE